MLYVYVNLLTFGSLRQSYIKGNLKEGQMSPVLNTWEQGKISMHPSFSRLSRSERGQSIDSNFVVCAEVFFLFSLHDYDKSGKMDGLEMMKLLSDFLSHHSLGPQSADSVSGTSL